MPLKFNFNIAFKNKKVSIICSNTFNIQVFIMAKKSEFQKDELRSCRQLHCVPLGGAAVPPFSDRRRAPLDAAAARVSPSLSLITLCVSPPLFIILSHPSSPRHLPCPSERRIHGVCDLEAVRFCVCVLVYEPGLLFVCA